MDQRLFILGRESALKDLLQRDPELLPAHQDVHRLRHHLDDSRLGDRRHHLRHDERQDRPREDDGGDAASSIRASPGCPAWRTSWVDFTIYRFLVGLGVGGMFGAATTLVAESVPAAFRRDGARLAAGAVGGRQHHRLAPQPADSTGRGELCRRLRWLARALLRRHSSGAAGRADHLRAQGAGVVAEGEGRRGGRHRSQERRIAVRAVSRPALAAQHDRRACSSASPA